MTRATWVILRKIARRLAVLNDLLIVLVILVVLPFGVDFLLGGLSGFVRHRDK